MDYPEFIVSSGMVDIIKGLLDVNPATRYTAVQIKNHRYFEGFEWEKLYKQELKAPLVPVSLFHYYYNGVSGVRY